MKNKEKLKIEGLLRAGYKIEQIADLYKVPVRELKAFIAKYCNNVK